MKTLICAAVLASLPLQAEELQFDLTGTLFVPDSNTPVGPIDVSFMLDTTKSTVSFVFADSFLSSFHGTASLSNLNVLLNGQSVLFQNSAGGPFGGDNWTTQALGGCFCGMTLDTASLYWSFDAEPGITQAALSASADPLATLLLNFQWDPGAATGYGNFDGLDLEFSKVTVSDAGPSSSTTASVSEPGTVALLLLSLASLLFLRKWRRARD